MGNGHYWVTWDRACASGDQFLVRSSWRSHVCKWKAVHPMVLDPKRSSKRDALSVETEEFLLASDPEATLLQKEQMTFVYFSTFHFPSYAFKTIFPQQRFQLFFKLWTVTIIKANLLQKKRKTMPPFEITLWLSCRIYANLSMRKLTVTVLNQFTMQHLSARRWETVL